jgi:hypothetical protein
MRHRKMESNHTTVSNVGKPSAIITPFKVMIGLTLERNPMNIRNVGKSLHILVLLESMKRLTLERNYMNEKNSQLTAFFKFMQELILECKKCRNIFISLRKVRGHDSAQCRCNFKCKFCGKTFDFSQCSYKA